jgi:hypothetical protein
LDQTLPDNLDDAFSPSIGAKHLIIYRQQPTIGATLDVQQRFAEECPALP